MKIERISKSYYSSSKKESVAVVIPKTIRELCEINAGDYLKWVLTVDDDLVKLSVTKVD